mgnify:CR=1 FL=1
MQFTVSQCPICAAPVAPNNRICDYCNSILIPLSNEHLPQFNKLDINQKISEIREKLKKDPDDAFLHYSLGIAYANKGIRENAITEFKKSIASEPEHAIVHYNLGIALFDDGNVLLNSNEYADALKEMDSALVNDKAFKEAAAFRSFFLARKLETVDPNQAIDEYGKAIQLCPDIGTFWNNAGLLFLNMNKMDKAIEFFKKAVEISDSFMCLNNLCLAYYKTGQFVLGVEVGQKAISKITTTTINAGCGYSNLAICFLETKKLPEALETINKALAMEPNNSIFLQNKKTILDRQNLHNFLFLLKILLGFGFICYLWLSHHIVYAILVVFAIYVFKLGLNRFPKASNQQEQQKD